MRRRLLLVLTAVVLVLLGTSVAVATTDPQLHTSGPTSVDGTDATAVFTVGDRTLRQVRYHDFGILRYQFDVVNDSRVPVTVNGTGHLGHEARLFHYRGLVDEDGARRFTVPGGGSVPVTLVLHMTGCQTLSARSGSFVTDLVLETTTAGMVDHQVRVALPEQLHTGSPREAGCANATAHSRPPG